MAKIQRYQSQFVSPVSGPRSSVAAQQAEALGQSVTGFAQAAAGTAGVVGGIAQKMFDEKNTRDFANARSEYQNFLTDLQSRMRETAFQRRRDGSVNYETFTQQYEEEAKKFAEQQSERMSHRQGREQFRNWITQQSANDRAAMTTLSWEMQVEESLTDLDRNLSNAAEMGGEEGRAEYGRLLTEAAQTGVISNADARKLSENASRGIHMRDIALEGYNAASISDSEREGMEIITERMGDEYTDILTGETRTLNTADREQLVSDFQQKWQGEMRMRRDERLTEFYEAYQYFDEMMHAGTLTVEMLTSDPRSPRTKFDPFDIVDHFMQRVHRASEGDPDNTEDAWAQVAFDLWSNEQLSDREYQRRMLDHARDMPIAVFERYINRPRPFVSEPVKDGRSDIESYFQQEIRNAEREEDAPRAAELRVQRNAALTRFDETIDRGMRSQLTPGDFEGFVTHAAANIISDAIDQKGYRALSSIALSEDRFGEGIQQWSILGLRFGRTEVLQFQDAIQRGATVGYEDVFQDSLNRTAATYATAMGNYLGAEGTPFLAPNNQPFLEFYLPNSAQMGSYSTDHPSGDEQIVSMTYMVDPDDRGALTLMVWDHASGSWHKVDKELAYLLKENDLYKGNPENRGEADNHFFSFLDLTADQSVYLTTEQMQEQHTGTTAARGLPAVQETPPAERRATGRLPAEEIRRQAAEAGVVQ